MPLPDIPATEAAIVAQTNAFRAEQKLSAVKPNIQLQAAARAYAQLLARTATFAHDADGRQPGDRAQVAGYASCQISENLALNLDSRGFDAAQLSKLAVDGWKASPGHRRNMVAPHVTDIGVAVARAPDNNPKFISVQLFGRPLSLRYSFVIANRSGGEVAYRLDSSPHSIAQNMTVTHTTCAPHELSFSAVSGRYTTRAGVTYALSAGPLGSVAVKVTEPTTTSAPAATLKRP